MKALNKTEIAAAHPVRLRGLPKLDNSIGPAIEAAGIGIWQLDMTTGLATWDSTTSRILGRGECQSSVPAPLPIHPDDLPEVERRLLRNALGEGERDVEVRVITPTGESRWVRATARAPRNAEEKARWVVGIVSDIDDRKRAEAALTEAERRLSALISNLPGIAYRCSLTPPWPMTFVSDGVQLLTGFAADEVLSDGFSWAQLIHANDLGWVSETVGEAVRAGESFSISYRILTRSGETRWVLEKGRSVCDAAGEAIFLEGFIGDITEQKRAEAEAVVASKVFSTRLDCVPQMIWSVGPDGHTDYYRNKQWYDFTGWAADAQDFSDWRELIHAEDRPRVAEAWAESLATGAAYHVDYRIRHCSGEYRWISSRGSPELDSAGSIVHWYGTCTDIHDRVLAEQRATSIAELTQGVLQASPDCVSLLDLEGTVLHVNQATLDCYGVYEYDLIGRPWGFRLSSEHQPLVDQLLARARAGRVGRGTVSVVHTDAGLRWWDMVVSPVLNARGEVVRIAVTSRDVSDQRRSEEVARWAATHDPLTKLPNRTLLTQELQRAIGRRGPAMEPFALVLVDVDHFKTVNDTLGHDAGDALLCSLGERLIGSVRVGDFVARLGGDEFALVLHGLRAAEELQPVLEKVIAELRAPFLFKGRIMDVGASIGASIYPRDGQTRTGLLKNADVALYAAKKAGRGTCMIFAPQMREQMQQRASMISLAKQALAQDWVIPHYQPKVVLSSGELIGFEALLRWQHPRKGTQNPHTVAAAFEDLNLAQQLTDRMLACVIRDLKAWQDLGVPFGHVAINAAASDFRRGDFAERVLSALARASIPAPCLQVEVTETVFLGRGAECVESALKVLSSEGIKVALDDFGTGYASLSHLKQFPVDIIKIDKSFVADLEGDANASAIVHAVLNLGRGLSIAVVAEGVETWSQHETLLGLGCKYGQGYLYGHPLAAKDAAAIAASPRRVGPIIT